MRKNLLLAVFSICFALGVLEAGVRVLCRLPVEGHEEKPVWVEVPEKKWVDYHPILGWFPEKNKTALLETSYVRVEVHTNSQGLRGTREYADQKPQRGTRLLALGDSFTFGFGVEDEQVFTHRLEESFTSLEVPNFGVAGYGIDQVLMLYRQIAKKYEADYVLINVFPEMFWRATRSFTAGGYAKPYFRLDEKTDHLLLKNVPVPKPYEMKTGQFPDLFHESPLERFLSHSLLYRLVQIRLIRLSRKLHLIDPDLSPDWILGRRILLQLAREAQISGMQPVIVIIPPEHWVRSPEKNQPRRSLLRFAERNQLPLLDLTDAFYEAGRQSQVTDYYIEGDWHWTARGHDLAAREIARFMREKILADHGLSPAMAESPA